MEAEIYNDEKTETPLEEYLEYLVNSDATSVEIETEICIVEKKEIPQEKYNLVNWTQYENLFRERAALRNKVLAEISVPFTIALQVKLQRSVLGCYLDDFNENQVQNEFFNTNKLCITETEMKDFTEKKWDIFEYDNNVFNKIMNLLKAMITETEQIDCRYLYNHATLLRLDDYHINVMDDGLKNFKKLQVLVICGNWISDIDGAILPRGLKFLELYVNEIASLENLVHKSPKELQHLGLARNKLTNDSGLHLLGTGKCLNYLNSLDLSECDIYNLVEALQSLKALQALESLYFQGNPCSMVMGYKDIVLKHFPLLIFLDGIEILKADREISEEALQKDDVAELIVRCPKLVGLPKPPKAEKKVKQTIHIEFTLPLFQESTLEELETEEPKGTGKSKKGKGKDKKKKPKKEKKAKKGGSKKKGSQKSDKIGKDPYKKDNEYNPKKINNSFQTQRKPWSNNIKFAPMVIKSPENNLNAYRDTFRSNVNVRVVYLQFLPPEKKKKGKKKDKKKKGKSSKSSKSSKPSKSSKSTGSKKDKKSGKGKKDKGKKKGKQEEKEKKEEKPPEEPKETILKEITLMKFSCDLLTIGWKDDIVFYWSEEPSFGNKAMELQKYKEMKEAEARAIKEAEEQKKKELELQKKQKLEKKNKKGKDKKSKGDKKSKKSAKSKKSKKTKKSKKSKKSKSKSSKKSKKDKDYVNCTVSFGLDRCKHSHEEIEQDVSKVEIKKKKKRKHKK